MGMRFGSNIDLSDVQQQLGYNADRKIMDARLAGLTTDDLKLLADYDILRQAGLDWHNTHSVIQALDDRGELLAKVIQAGLNPQEIKKLKQRKSLTKESLDTVIAIQERSPDAARRSTKTTSGKRTMREKLEEASKKI